MATNETFTNPIITSTYSSPDPWLTYHDGYYYFCKSENDGVQVWKSASITGIDKGPKVQVWAAPEAGAYSKEVWAPELHFINSRWYIYVAASDGNNDNHRMYVLEAETDDPQGSYTFKGRIHDPADKWAIDGTVLQADNGALYFIWSGWPGDINGLQNLYIAPMSDSCTISGERVLISTPDQAWESWINEGPQILKHQGQTFLIYSANCSWTPDYCLGLLHNESGDFLNPAAWTKLDQPVFSKYEDAQGGVYCVGHCSFVKSPDETEDWLIYHAKDSADEGWEGRQTRAQKFGWQPNGLPDFGHPIPSGVPLNLPA